MKQKIDYYCRGCESEVTIFGNLSKNASVYCKVCNIMMFQVKLAKKGLKSKLKDSGGRD